MSIIIDFDKIVDADNEFKITAEKILSKISEYDIFRYYSKINDLELGKLYSSPFRKDSNPSFNVPIQIFLSKSSVIACMLVSLKSALFEEY